MDLSVEANPPFTSPDGRLWLVCNGEIYNAPEIRQRYARQGYPFRSSHSDVEALVPLFLERGESALDEIEGMFALALWDAGRRELLLARDRAGEKPLFFSHRDGEIHFSSEVQTLVAAMRTNLEISRAGLSDYLTLGYCLAPHSILDGIEKLDAGHLLIANAGGTHIRPFWRALSFALQESRAEPGRILDVLDQAVRRQTMADVPVGAFVSGGLDSSLLLSSLARQMPAEAIHTYAVRFEQASYDESAWAEQVCRAVGTTHHTVRAGLEDLCEALDFISTRLAEPLGDPAILPVHLLAEAAAQEVKVVFSGEGADELFGGYPTYLGHRWAERFRRLPVRLKAAIAGVVRRLPVTSQKISLSFLARRFVEEAEHETLDRHLAWFGALGAGAATLGTADMPAGTQSLWSRLDGIHDPVKRVMLFDLLTYLAENLLTKLDRATMLSSVEARAPYLDRELMELALRQPIETAVGSLDTKIALKRAAEARLRRNLVHRRKRGLSVPIAQWINGELREEVDRLLDAQRLLRQGLLDPAPVMRMLDEHRDRRADHGRRLWPLFMLQRWYEHWIENADARKIPCDGYREGPAAVAAAR